MTPPQFYKNLHLQPNFPLFWFLNHVLAFHMPETQEYLQLEGM